MIVPLEISGMTFPLYLYHSAIALYKTRKPNYYSHWNPLSINYAMHLDIKGIVLYSSKTKLGICKGKKKTPNVHPTLKFKRVSGFSVQHYDQYTQCRFARATQLFA